MLVIFAPVMPQLTCQMPVQLCNFAMLTGLGVKQQLSSPKQTIAQCSTEEILQILGAWKDYDNARSCIQKIRAMHGILTGSHFTLFLPIIRRYVIMTALILTQ